MKYILSTFDVSLLSDSPKYFWQTFLFQETVIIEGEVIPLVGTKFKLALNNWTKTFK